MFDLLAAYTPFIAGAGALLGLIALVWILMIEVRVRAFMRGKNGENLEGMLSDIQKKNEVLLKEQKEMQDTLTVMHKRLQTAARGIATIRFNAFGGRGESGAQSFATAVVSEEGNGVVFSSMHTREQTRMFAKEVKGFSSEHELTDEEKEVIEKAKKVSTL